MITEQKCETSGLSKHLKELETSILLQAWNTILERINKTSNQLQKEGLSLTSAVHLFESLLTFIESLRDRFDDFEMCDNSSCKNDVKRNRKGKRIHILPKEYFKTYSYLLLIPEHLHNYYSYLDIFIPIDTLNTFVSIIDNLNSALRFRLEAYKFLTEGFGFLSRLTGLTERYNVKLHLILSTITQMI